MRFHVNYATCFSEEAGHAQAHTHTRINIHVMYMVTCNTCIFDRSFSRIFVEICISFEIALNTYPTQDVL